jgi:hypothetical protein
MEHPMSTAGEVRATLVCLIGLLIGGNCGAFLFAQEMTIEDLQKKLASRGDGLNPHVVKFEMEMTESKEWQAKFDKGKDLKEKATKISAGYACKGEKTKSWGTRQVVGLAPEKESFQLFDGDASIWPSNTPDVFMLSRKKLRRYEGEPPLEIVRESETCRCVSRIAKGEDKPSRTSITDKEENEKHYVVFEVEYPNKWHSKAWLLPKQGFALVRAEQYVDCRLVYEMQVEEFTDVNGVSYPSKGWRKVFMEDKSVGYETKFKVQSVKVGAKDVPDSHFQFNLPHGARLWDNDLKMWIQ